MLESQNDAIKFDYQNGELELILIVLPQHVSCFDNFLQVCPVTGVAICELIAKYMNYDHQSVKFGKQNQ